MAAMAHSEVTPAVRNLLGRRQAEPGTPRPSPTSMEITQINGPGKEATKSLDLKPAQPGAAVGGRDAARSATLKLVPNAEAESAAVDTEGGANPTPKVDSDLPLTGADAIADVILKMAVEGSAAAVASYVLKNYGSVPRAAVRRVVEVLAGRVDATLLNDVLGRVVMAPGANPTPKVDSDLWSEEDRLGYEAYARTIASLITHKETRPPLTIGIKAPWGAGKTTLMKRVQHLLDGYAELSEAGGTEILQDLISRVTLQELLRALKGGVKPVKLREKRSEQGKAYGLPQRITVWFNAWKYQTSEQIWAGMAHCIIAQVTARMDFKDRELFWLRLHARRVSPDAVRRKVYLAIFKYVLPYLVIFALVALGALILPVAWYYRFGAIVLSLVPAALASWRKYRDKASETVRDLVNEPDYEGRMGYLHLVESDIRKVLELASAASRTDGNPNGDPLVIFVDDLDRCEPNKVAEVVQAINLFLCGDYPNCIFVLGMEPGMVAAALEVANQDVIQKAEEMGLVDRTAPVGWRFMEKIVQLPIMIPPPTESGRRKYVNSLTGLSMESGVGVATLALKENQGAVGTVQISRPSQHGAEEEEKVQSYMRKIGPAKSATEAARKSEDVLKQASDEERWAAQEAGKRVYEQTLSERDPVTSLFVDEVAQLVDGNPRQIKRYVNVFRFYSTLRHSLRLEGVIPSDDLPDKVLAKFVALSIQWPHAVDCIRVMVEGAEGKKLSLLNRLETESRGLSGDGATADEAWKKVVDELKLPAWAEERAFREFLSRGESLCAKEGHGLW
jgi:hypothetical protein